MDLARLVPEFLAELQQKLYNKKYEKKQKNERML